MLQRGGRMRATRKDQTTARECRHVPWVTLDFHTTCQLKPIIVGQLLMHMLPLLMMRHRRIPRSKWKDCVTSHGKHWIEQVSTSPYLTFLVPILHVQQSPEDMAPNKFLHSMIGYHLAVESSICGMAMTQGMQKRVVNVGLGIKKLAAEPKGATVADFVRSQSHKVSQLRPTHNVPSSAHVYPQ